MDSDTLMDPTTLTSLIPIVTLIVIGIGIAIGNGFVAKRLGHSQALWIVLSLIPFFNTFFYVYVFFVVLLAMLDRLNALTSRLNPPTT